MVVYTPRLCDDVAFLPPREDRANGVQCREIMDSKSMDEFYMQKAKSEQADALEMLREAARTAALRLAADEGLGVGVAVGGKKVKSGDKKTDGKKGGKKVEVGGKKVEVKKNVEKGDRRSEQIVFVKEAVFDDRIKDEEPEEEEEDDDEDEGEWILHQEL